MSKSTYAYVLNCVQSGTGQYSTGQYTKWYKAVQVKVYHGTRQYMVVHVSTRSASAFAPGRGRGGRGGDRFQCSFESAALTAPTVASASSHCMHKLVYSSPGTLACASPATAPSFATSWQRRPRRQLAMLRLASRGRSRGWRRHILIPGPTCAVGRRGGLQEGRQHVEAKRRLRLRSWW